MKNKKQKKSEVVIFKKSRYILTRFFLKNDDNDFWNKGPNIADPMLPPSNQILIISKKWKKKEIKKFL